MDVFIRDRNLKVVLLAQRGGGNTSLKEENAYL